SILTVGIVRATSTTSPSSASRVLSLAPSGKNKPDSSRSGSLTMRTSTRMPSGCTCRVTFGGGGGADWSFDIAGDSTGSRAVAFACVCAHASAATATARSYGQTARGLLRGSVATDNDFRHESVQDRQSIVRY